MTNRRSGFALGAIALVVGWVTLLHDFRRYEIAEASMRPALFPGDYVIARRHRFAHPRGLRRGDIVILPHPEVTDMELVKRVVGVPGEEIVVSDGRVHVDNVALAEPWADGPTGPDGSWRLRADQFFLLGDNRAFSTADSRQLGTVDASLIASRVVACYWPPPRIGRLVAG